MGTIFYIFAIYNVLNVYLIKYEINKKNIFK